MKYTMADVFAKFERVIDPCFSGKIKFDHERMVISTHWKDKKYCLDMNTLEQIDYNCVAFADYEEQVKQFSKPPICFTEEQKQEIKDYEEIKNDNFLTSPSRGN
jgi:hypothetical protein